MAFAITTTATVLPDDEDQFDESIRKPVRRLYPNRERDKLIKKHQQEQERLVKQKKQAQQAQIDDPWAEGAQNQNPPSPDKAELYALLNKDYSTPTPIIPSYDTPEPYKWVDETPSTSESSLLKRVSRVALNPGARYIPLSAKSGHNVNDIFFYFDEYSQPEDLMLCVQYYADDPLNFHQVNFLIDGFEYSYRPRRTSTGKGSGRMIWEESDNPVAKADKDLVYALTHCQWVQMSLVGDGGMKHVKMLTDNQLENLRTMLQLFLLRGGRI